MKKLHIIIVCILANTALFIACFSGPEPRPLDLREISGDIPIYSVELIIRKDLDIDGMGEAGFRNILIGKIHDIKETLLAEGIRTDTETFLDEYNTSPNILFEEWKIAPGFILHRYYWNSQVKPELHMKLQLNAVLLEDGRMPLLVRINKDDPDYEPGYTATRTLHIVPQRMVNLGSKGF